MKPWEIDLVFNHIVSHPDNVELDRVVDDQAREFLRLMQDDHDLYMEDDLDGPE